MDIVVKVDGLEKVYPKFSLKDVSFSSMRAGFMAGFLYYIQL